VKDDFSIHVLKDVAISSALLASLRMTMRVWRSFFGGIVDHSTTRTQAATKTCAREIFPVRHLLRQSRCIAQGQGSALTPNTAEQKHNP
jgi:hypothetical protein